MKHASQDAVERAARILLVDVEKENEIISDYATGTTNIENLDIQANTAQTALRSIYLLLSRSVADTRRKRNNLLPVYQLPPEILVQIFQEALAEIPSHLYFTALYKLARVCYLWSNVIKDAHALWAHLSANIGQALFKVALERSHSVPLRITFTQGHAGQKDHIHRKLSAVLKRIGRWGHVDLQLANGQQQSLKKNYLEQPAPLLTHLSLSVPLAMGSTTVVDLFKGEAPCLQHLALRGISIPFHSPMLSGLSHFELIHVIPGPTVTQLYHILRACPSIRTLILTSVYGSGSSELPQEELPLVLPELKKLRITAVDVNYLSMLMPNLRAPILDEIALHVQLRISSNPTSTVSVPSLLHELLGSIADSARKILSSADSFTIQLSDCHFHLREGTSKQATPRINLGLTDAPGSEIFSWVMEMFKDQLAEKSTTLSLERIPQLTDPLFLSALESLHGVTSLSLPRPHVTMSLRPFLEILGEPVVGACGTKRFPLPLLRELTLITLNDAGLDGLLEALRKRYGKDEAGEDAPSDDIELPVPLEGLMVHCRDEPLRTQLRDLVGADVMKPPATLNPLAALGPPPPNPALANPPQNLPQPPLIPLLIHLPGPNGNGVALEPNQIMLNPLPPA